MPTDAECLAFFNEQHAKGSGAWEEGGKAVRERWPNKVDRMAYYDWSEKRADDKMKQEMTPISREDLKTMIATMNYNSKIARGKLVTAVDRPIVPWLPVGSHQNGGIYRIVPGAYGLQPDQPDPKTDRTLVSMNVLGVNTNVQPTLPVRSRKANFSEASTKSNESDDSEIAGFVFHQIGTLEYWGDKDENFHSFEDAARGPWLPTGFRVVVRFGRNGAANGIYIIYDFYPKDAWGERELKITGDYWGRLPQDRSNQQFSIAKLADTIIELRFGRKFTLTEVLDYPVEIVRAMKTPEDAIIRVTIA
ncbi:MAG: hypothetical protein M1813_005395 [Trichoglossum hirsutum]|nr:MAG: hypothetical protein M1813_005395 [Trichoglossum hirsutum]